MTNHELLDRLRCSTPGALDDLQQKHGSMLRYCIRGILPDPRDQEECMADLLLQISQRIHRYNPAKGALEAWMATIARNTALNRARSIQRSQNGLMELSESLPDPAPTPEETLLRKERARYLLQAVDQLTNGERLLFYRRYYYLQPASQIAAELGLSVRAVEGRLYRLRQKLRHTLGDEFYGE